MTEIFLLGGLVTFVKLGDMATMVPEVGFWTFCGFILAAAAAGATLDPGMIWDAAEQGE